MPAGRFLLLKLGSHPLFVLPQYLNRLDVWTCCLPGIEASRYLLLPTSYLGDIRMVMTCVSKRKAKETETD